MVKDREYRNEKLEAYRKEIERLPDEALRLVAEALEANAKALEAQLQMTGTDEDLRNRRLLALAWVYSKLSTVKEEMANRILEQ